MSRAGYSDDCDDNWAMIRWAGQVSSAIRGKRGQAFFRELAAAMDAMPEKVLITEELKEGGCYCTLGALAAHKGLDIDQLDTHNWGQLADTFNIASALAREVMYWNDEHDGRYDAATGNWRRETPAERWTRMREWVAKKIIETPDVADQAAT